MKRATPIAWGLLCLVLASIAWGERATPLLDDVETALEAKAVALADDDSKAGKKALKTATQALKKLGKDTTSETADVKLLKKVAGAVLKRFADDAALTQEIVDAADAVDASIDADLVAARALVPVGKKVTAAKVTKGIDKAQALLDKSRAQDTKPRIAVLFKARKATDKALATAAKLKPKLEFDANAYVLASGSNGSLDLEELDLDSGRTDVIDTGAGEVALDEPRPLTAPDGRALAFRRGDEMVIVDLSDADGPVASRSSLAADWEFISWSPDSMVVAVASRGPDTLALFDRQANTVYSLSELVRPGFPSDETFFWSRDGAFVAYRTDRDGDRTNELRVVRVADGENTQVSADTLRTDQLRFFAWSRLSDRLVYAANTDRTSFDTELVVVDADGTGSMVLSPAGQDVRDFGSDGSPLQMNPVGESVLYEFFANGSASLATVHLDGSEAHVIATAGPDVFGRRRWSPDGSRIAYIDRGALFSCNPDGTDTVQITDTCPDFQWAPDGSALIYRVGDGFAATELWVSDPDGSDPTEISPALGNSGNVGQFYAGTVLGSGLAVLFVADSAVDNRPDLHVVIVRDLAPAKLSEVFRKRLSSQARFKSGEYAMKEMQVWPFSREIDDGPSNTDLREDILYVAVTVCNSKTKETTTEYYRFTVEEVGAPLPFTSFDLPRLHKFSFGETFHQLVVDPLQGAIDLSFIRGQPFVSRPQ